MHHVAIVGAGAIGSLLGALLSRRCTVTLACREAHADAIRARGLRVTGLDEFIARPQATTEPEAVAAADLVLVTTKAFAVESALAAIRAELGEPEPERPEETAASGADPDTEDTSDPVDSDAEDHFGEGADEPRPGDDSDTDTADSTN